MNQFKKFSRTFLSYALNVLGKQVKGKYIVIESDDWGSIRMPNLKARERLLAIGAIKESNHYARFDTIASDEDWEHLLSCLGRFKDVNDNYPVITANYIMANPDFERIRKSDFEYYYHEDFLTTTRDYPNSANYSTCLQQAMNARMFRPQFHGREHVNVENWLSALRKGYQAYHEAFENKCFFVEPNSQYFHGKDIFAALDYDDASNLQKHKEALKEGLEMFRGVFGYGSKTYIAPNYIWSSAHEDFLFRQGVVAMQGTKFRNDPQGLERGYRRKLRLMGRGGVQTPVSLVRNCFFEPSSGTGAASIKYCLRDIGIAFKCSQPAIISTHRLNFLGEHYPQNRIDNLNYLQTLLKNILKKWPEVQFISTDNLLRIYGLDNLENELSEKK